MEILEIDFQQPSLLIKNNISGQILILNLECCYKQVTYKVENFFPDVIKYIDLETSDGYFYETSLNCDDTAWADGYLYQIKLIKTIQGIFLV